MNEKEEELLTGMRNCYTVCGRNFQETVRMVSRARDRDPGEVIETLKHIKDNYGSSKKYRELRNDLPKEFPI